MGIRFSFIIMGAILAGIGFVWVLSTTIAAFGAYQTFASIVLTLALALIVIWLLLLELTRFYFHANHLGGDGRLLHRLDDGLGGIGQLDLAQLDRGGRQRRGLGKSQPRQNGSQQ